MRFGYNFEDAKNTIAMLPLFAIFFGPLVSVIVTKTGNKPLCFTFACGVVTGIFFYLRTLPAEPSISVLVCVIGIGLFYSAFVAIIWPSLTLSVP
jgi:hypothetical protein